MCRVLGVSHSGFCDWFERPPSERDQENERLLKSICLSHQASDNTYGSPRVFRDLHDAGHACSENRDLFSRRVVGWSMQPTMTSQLVMDALLMAVFRRGRPKSVLHHSDQGPQYTSENFQRLLNSHGIVCSMSRRGNCWDNAAMENFFSTMKTERLAKRHYKTRDELRADVFDYIERLYNPRRRHSTLGYISPVQSENLKSA